MALTFHDVQAARERIAPYAVKTPLLRLHALDDYLGCQVYVKAECMQVTGSFKYRGAMNKILSLTKEELEAVSDPMKFTGMALQQTETFLREQVRPILDQYADCLGQEAVVSV